MRSLRDVEVSYKIVEFIGLGETCLCVAVLPSHRHLKQGQADQFRHLGLRSLRQFLSSAGKSGLGYVKP
jgi:hypothetical protein